jgi:hypothetical protein
MIKEKIQDVKTPFNIEFSRTSSSRDGAPTLVLVENHGLAVNGQILILKEEISLEEAKNLLWRRETRNERSEKKYKKVDSPSKNKVVVEVLENFNGIDYVLYTKIGANIENPTPEKLADLAIESAKKKAGKESKDGISYLISVKRQGIETPLMKEYEQSILKKLNAETLEDALTTLKLQSNE